MNNKQKLWTAIIALIVLIGIGYYVLQQPLEEEAGTIKIGAILPLTGEISSYGESSRNGFELYRKINNIEISLNYEDTRGEPRGAVSAARKLLGEQTNLLLGLISSGDVNSVYPITQEKAIIITPSASQNVISNYENVFRVCVSDEIEGNKIAQEIIKIRPNGLGIIYWESDWAIGIKDKIIEFLNHDNYSQEITSDSYQTGNRNFRNIIEKYRSNDIEGVLIIGNRDEAESILNQMLTVDYKPTIFGTSLFETSIKNILDDNEFNYSFVSRTPDWEDNQVAENFYQEYYSEYNIYPDVFAALSFDAALVTYSLVDSIKSKNIDFTYVNMREQLLHINIQGVSGELSFNKNGDLKTGNLQVVSNFN